MNRSEIFQNFVDTVLPDDNRQVKWLLGWVALALGIGFWVADVTTSNYLTLKQFAPVWVWAILFMVYGLKKILSCLFRIPFIVTLSFSAMGLYLWGYLFISFVIIDITNVQASEYMIIFPLLTEVWILSKIIFDVVYINFYNKS